MKIRMALLFLISGLALTASDVYSKNRTITMLKYLYNDTWPEIHGEAWRGNEDGVRRLIEKGVDPNTRNVTGITALMLATYYKYNEIVEILKEAGAEAYPINPKHFHGR